MSLIAVDLITGRVTINDPRLPLWISATLCFLPMPDHRRHHRGPARGPASTEVGLLDVVGSPWCSGGPAPNWKEPQP